MNFKNAREKKGYTQEKLAEMLSVDRSTVAKWETGAALPSAAKLPALAEALGCKIDELFVKEREEIQL